jgi:hypothetical protein
MDDSKAITSKRQSFGIKPLLILVVPFVFVVVVWIISYSYFRHPFKNGQPLENRIATNAAVGEAMAITSVLFSGLGFVALIATVWLQREQIQAAIQGMEDSTKAQQENLKTLRAQSENTLVVAKISALAVRISAYNSDIQEAAIRDSVKKADLAEKRKRLVEELEAELQKLKEKEKSA